MGQQPKDPAELKLAGAIELIRRLPVGLVRNSDDLHALERSFHDLLGTPEALKLSNSQRTRMLRAMEIEVETRWRSLSERRMANLGGVTTHAIRRLDKIRRTRRVLRALERARRRR